MATEYRVYGYRWVNLGVYTLIAFVAGAGYLAVAPILDTLAVRWSIALGAASLLLAVFGLAEILLPIPTGWVSGKIGFKPPMAIGVSILALGFVLRSGASSYGFFLLYTALAALGWGLLMSPVANLAATWFPRREIGLANAVWPVGLIAGEAFGSMTVIPLTLGVGWEVTWLLYGILAVVVAALAWLLLRPLPPLPPEPRASVVPSGMAQGIKETMNSANRALLCTVFGAAGLLTMAPALVSPMLIAKGMAAPLAGLVSGLALLAGIPGNLLVPAFAFGRQRARPSLLVCAILAPLSFIALFYAPVANEATVVVLGLSMLFGFTISAVMGLSMGTGQLQPGVHAGNASILAGVFLFALGLGAAASPIVAGAIVDRSSVLPAAWVVALVLLIAVPVMAAFVPEPRISATRVPD